jgi:glycosyltransferase involved in cell wall biosynthesis
LIASRPIRAGFITPSLYWGGAERWLHDLALLTQGRIYWMGCAVTHRIYTDDVMKNKIGQIMPIWGYGRKAVQHVAKGADVMIAWGTDGLKNLVAGYNGKVVFTAHGSGPFDEHVVRGSISGATHLVAVSHKAVESYIGFVPLDSVTVLLNGVNPDRCRITRTKENVRQELGLNDEEFAVGYLGRLAPEKNPVAIASAIKLLPKRFRGVWIGDGWDLDHQKSVIQRTIGKRAIFHSRVEDIGNYLQAFDAFVLTSGAEGFSLATLEAMLVGVPIVCTDVGAMPELERQHGLHWESIPYPVDPRVLADAILRVEAMPNGTRWGMIRDCQEIVKTNYLAKHMASRWMNYLEEILRPE